MLVIRFLGVLILFFTDVLLGNLLGAGGFGEFSQIRATVLILSSVAIFGLDNYLIREVTILVQKGSSGAIRSLLWSANRFVSTISIAITAILILVVVFVGFLDDSETRIIFIVGALMIPAIVLTRTICAELRGFHLVLSAQFVEHAIAPSLLIMGVLGWWHFGFLLDSLTAVSIAVFSAFMAFFVSWVTLKYISNRVTNSEQQQQKAWSLWKVSIPFAVIAFTQIANAKSDILLIGIIRNDSESGIYAAASNVSSLLTFALIAMNVALAPLLVKLKETHSIEKVQGLITKVSRLGFLLSIPLFIVVFVYASTIISIYGEEFSSASIPLRILVVGQLANVSCGPVILLMMMLDLEKKAAVGSGMSLLLHIALSLLLIPSYGVVGATIATAITVCFLNVFMTILLIKNRHINPTPLF